jgi:hypothetical protein
MADFLKKAKQLHSRKAYGAESASIEDVLQAAYRDLKPVQVKSSIDYENVEELFSAIDIAQMIGSFGSRSSSTIEQLRKSIVVFIYRTIEETVRFPHDGKVFRPSKGYDTLAKSVRENVERTVRLGPNEISFITFNYDTCLEFALDLVNLGVDYGLGEPFLDDLANNFQVKIPVLKLHGSINWATCPKCERIVPTEVNPWRRAGAFALLDQPRELALSLGSRIASNAHRCGTPLDPLPVLVPPTWNKSSSTAPLKEVWRRAAKELGNAERIVVIGYSFPITDMFFKYLFALGSDSDAHLERFIVINGPNGADTAARFKGLLGPMTSQSFVFHPFLFSGAGHIIQELLTT